MRLLSAPEGKSRRDTEIASQEIRVQELEALIIAKRKEISNLDATIVRTLSESGTKNYEEEQAWKAKIRELTREVEALESRRKSALVPLEIKEKELEDKERSLLEREETAIIKESDLEHTRQLLEDRLDDVSEREQSSVDYSNTLSNREYALQVKESELESRTAILTQTLKESLESIELTKQELAKQKAVLKGREVSLIEREQNVTKKETGFADREKSIVDRYKTLLSAINETKLKQNVIIPDNPKRAP